MIDAGCLVLGYSAARGDGLRTPPMESLSAVIARECAICQGRTRTLAQGGEKMSWVREQLCNQPDNVRPTEIIFFGGGNDDFFWGSRTGLIADSISLLNFAVERPSPAQWSKLFDQASEKSLRRMTEQSTAVGETIRCARAHGSRFWLVHDFMAWDLETGRSGARSTMASARRVAAEQSGAEFLDLYDLFGREAGVSWFNDFIHPSAIGHRHIARSLCERMRR
jgi:hypothetical protein